MTPTSTVTATDEQALRPTLTVQMLVFQIRREEFCVPLTEIKEIMKIMPLTPVPHAMSAIRGIVNVRGKVATAVDVATILGLATTQSEPKYMIVAEDEKTLFVLIVDDVVGVLRTSAENCRPTPALFESKAAAAFISGALVIPKESADAAPADDTSIGDSRIIVSLNLSAIFAAIQATSSR